MDVKDVDSAVENYYSLKPTSFHDLVRFEIKAETDDVKHSVSMSLRIELAPKEHTDRSLLRLTFLDISDLTYVPGYWSFAFIDIVPLQNQWERKRYRVFETEQDTNLSLLCDSFQAEVVSR